MDPKRMPQRQAVQPRQTVSAPTSTQQPSLVQATHARKQRGRNKKLIVGAVALLVIAALVYGLLSWFRIVGPMAGVKADKYQAVFLANAQAQVYFGKIAAITPDTIVLRDVYYIKSPNQTPENKAEDQQAQAVLTRLDNNSELHSPYDEMRINRDQVLFWENLKDDSKIVKTIKSDTNN